MITKACDACHVRRTKCTGGQPCERCSKSGLSCTYLKPARKKGRPGKVVTQIRRNQAAGGTALRVQPADGVGGLPLESPIDLTGLLGMQTDEAFTFSPFPPELFANTSSAPVPLPLNLDLDLPGPSDYAVRSLRYHAQADLIARHERELELALDEYFDRMYPICPIVNPETVRARVHAKQHFHDARFAALVLALAGLGLIMPGAAEVAAEGGAALHSEFINASIALHNTVDLGEEPSLEVIATSMTLGAYVTATIGPKAAFIRQSESVALLDALRLHSPDGYERLDPPDKEIALTIFWILAVSERSRALVQVKPLILRRKMLEPEVVIGHAPSAFSRRLQPITELFNALDPDLIDCINEACPRRIGGGGGGGGGGETGDSTCSFDVLKAVQTQQALERVEVDADLSEMQKADLVLTRQWLQVKVWQACVTHLALQDNWPVPELRVEFPLYKLLACKVALETCSSAALEANGRCLGLKLCFVADVAASTLSLLPPSSPFSVDAPRAIARLRDEGQRLLHKRWMRFELPSNTRALATAR